MNVFKPQPLTRQFRLYGGHEAIVHRNDVTAIEQDRFDDQVQVWRATLHLRGGGTIAVEDSYDHVAFWYDESMRPIDEQEWRSRCCVKHGGTAAPGNSCPPCGWDTWATSVSGTP